MGFEFRSDGDAFKERLYKAGCLLISCKRRGMSSKETWKEMDKAGYTDGQKITTLKVVIEFLELMKKDPHKYDKSVEEDLGKYK